MGTRHFAITAPFQSTLKELVATGGIPVRDDKLFTHSRLAVRAANAVFDIQSHHRKTVEHTQNIRMVMNTDHHLSLTCPHEFGHLFVLLDTEIHAIALSLPVRRGVVLKCMGSVVTPHARAPKEG